MVNSGLRFFSCCMFKTHVWALYSETAGVLHSCQTGPLLPLTTACVNTVHVHILDMTGKTNTAKESLSLHKMSSFGLQGPTCTCWLVTLALISSV